MAINNRRQRCRRRHRQRIGHNRLVDRENPLEILTETEVFKRYQFRPDTVLYIVHLLCLILRRDTRRSCALTPLLPTLVTLRFLATGCFYSMVADTVSSVSPSSICRAVRDVCRGLCRVSRQFIQMPTGLRVEEIKTQFYSIAGRYQGLPDSGYPCKPHLMTPYPAPSTPAEIKFNTCHAKTRVIIEQTFGILRKRFSCLHGGLRTTPGKACEITLACAVLHNSGIDRNDILDMDDGYVNHGDVNFNVRDQWDGIDARNYICRSFFA